MLKKLYLQGMQGCSELEGMSYQTPILKIKKFFWEVNSKIKMIKWKPKSVRAQS